MKSKRVWLAGILMLSLNVCAETPVAPEQSARLPNRTGYEYLVRVFDQFHKEFYVYQDFISAGNHFSERGIMCDSGDEYCVPLMDENCKVLPHSGTSCIKCRFVSQKSNWGGWNFMNSSLQGTQTTPQQNWGDVAGGGYNLCGATKLTFWARGEVGGERVKFFIFGIGRQPFTGKAVKPYPDSEQQISTGYLTLSTNWTQYTIDLTDKDLSRVLLGFAWQTKGSINHGQDITFYLDDIVYDKAQTDDARFLLSYETRASDKDFDTVLRNVAYTYDNALALLAFLGSGDLTRAQLLADAFLYAQKNDRFYADGRLRNAYQAGDLALPPGWAPNGRNRAARLPGWWDQESQQWLEDPSAVGTSAGNMAWTMLALLSYYEQVGGEEYLTAAERMGEWIVRHCRDSRGQGGYTAGYEGWEPTPKKYTHKSTEHNLDIYAAFQRLYLLTDHPAWKERANHALRFVQSMWDGTEKKFWTGTISDGVTIYKNVVPVDVQAWALMALKDHEQPYLQSLDYAESQLMVGQGFDFNQDTDGVWFEGTAQMAAAFSGIGRCDRQKQIVDFIKSAQHPSGGVYATDREEISTGFHLANGMPWLYYQRLHTGATSWLVLAENGLNPFWMGNPATEQLVSAKKTTGECK